MGECMKSQSNQSSEVMLVLFFKLETGVLNKNIAPLVKYKEGHLCKQL